MAGYLAFRRTLPLKSFEELGQRAVAREYYEKFLGRRRDADLPIPQVAEAELALLYLAGYAALRSHLTPSTGSGTTPSPSRYSEPSRNCALLSPWSARGCHSANAVA